MSEQPLVQRVEVRFVGQAPLQKIQRASGVSDVEADGPVVHCVVSGCFQPFLDALIGHEVISLESRSNREVRDAAV